MNPSSIARRLVTGELHYAFGRFEVVRTLYSFAQALQRPVKATAAFPGTLFPDVGVGGTLAALDRDSVAFGFDLPDGVREEIVAFAKTAELRDRTIAQRFRWNEVRSGHLPDGTPLVHGLVDSATQCPAVQRIARDPLLTHAAERFLGYRPKTLKPCLWWSFASPVDDEERRRRGQTIDWHYDVYDYTGFLASFYLTDVDAHSGPHALIRGSHRGKRLGMLLGSARASEEAVFGRFGPDRLLVIEGAAGTGFVENAACYHRAVPPLANDRLLLQLWFS